MGLKERIESGEAVLGVVGLGYVGLPLALEMAKAGHKVVGFEVSAEKADLVNAGTSYIPDVPQEEFAPLVEAGLISATTDFSRAGEVDAIAICVPTPLNDMKEPDTSYMESAARSVTPYLHPEMLITLESTTYPGTTEEIIQPILESGGLKVGSDIYLAFSPERVDPGNPVYQTRNTPKVIGGVTPACTENAVALYARYIDTVVPVSSTRVAEMTKLLENTFRGVNIALMNELLMLCERMRINLWEVVDALGREREEEVGAHDATVRLEDGLDDLLGGSGIRRGLQRHEHVRPQVRRDRRRGRLHVRGVGLLHLVKRGGHADRDGVALAGAREVRRRHERARRDQRRELVGGDVGDVALAGVDALDLVRRDVETDHMVTGLAHLDSEGKPDVAEPDDAEHRTPVSDALLKSHCFASAFHRGAPQCGPERDHNPAILSQT